MRGFHYKSKKRNFRLSQVFANFIAFGIFIYFTYHLLHGGQGYFAWQGIQDRLAYAQEEYDSLHKTHIRLENKVRMLRPESMDANLLEERARIVLGFVAPQEYIIIHDLP